MTADVIMDRGESVPRDQCIQCPDFPHAILGPENSPMTTKRKHSTMDSLSTISWQSQVMWKACPKNNLFVNVQH